MDETTQPADEWHTMPNPLQTFAHQPQVSGDVVEIAKAIFKAGFHPAENPTYIDRKWHEWPNNRAKAIKQAKAAIAAMSKGDTP